MNEATATQLRLITEISGALGTAGVEWWLFGGWGLDARIGRITRDHGDIEFFVRREQADQTRAALVACGFTAPPTDHPEEAQEFVKNGLDSSSAFFDRDDDGSIRVQGRWSDWRFPPNTFARPPGRIGELVVPAMSVEGMLAMKEQFASLRNGRPLRTKDVQDVARLRELLMTS